MLMLATRVVLELVLVLTMVVQAQQPRQQKLPLQLRNSPVQQ
jgi:hypothetical protein